MKKQAGKKLTFAHETLVVLQSDALDAVAGGVGLGPTTGRPRSIEPLVSCPAGPGCQPTGRP